MNPSLHLKLISFGLKTTHGADEPPADLYVDCRGVWDPTLNGIKASKSGDTEEVQAAIKGAAPVDAYYRMIVCGFENIPKRRRGEANPYARPYTIAFFCAYGIHRSRAMKHLIGNRLTAAGYSVEVV